MFKKYFIAICLLSSGFIFSTPSLGQDDQSLENQSSCLSEGFGFVNGPVVLNTDSSHQSRVFQIQNTTDGEVILDHFSETDPGMSAGWSSTIDGGNYSIISMTQANFPLKCMVSNPPVEFGLIDCKRVLTVCAIVTKYPLGSFWVSENKSLPDTIKVLKQRRLID